MVKRREYCKSQSFEKYTTEGKTKIMKMFDDRLKICEIYHLSGFPQSIIRTMRDKNYDINKSLSLAKKYLASNPSSHRHLASTYWENNKLIAMTEYYVEKLLSRLAKDGC